MNHILIKLWDVITHACTNYNDAFLNKTTVEVNALMKNDILDNTRDYLSVT